MHPLILHLSNALDEICSVEKDFFSAWGFFKKIPFEELGQRLDVQLAKLESLMNGFSAMDDDERKSIAIDYIRKLTDSTEHLRHMCLRLQQKAEGRRYDASEYKRDFDSFKRLQTAYFDAGANMNRILASM